MKTVQARLVTVRVRQSDRTLTMRALALRIVEIEVARDDAGLRIPLTTITDRLIPVEVF